VSQGGTGSGVSGPSVAELYKTLFGVDGSRVDLAAAAPPGGHPTRALPVVRPDGTVVQPGGRDGGGAATRTDTSAGLVPDLRARREDEGGG
jgi:hypothetical protein